MEQLPFRVKNCEPQIIYVGDTEVPKKVREERMGTNALVYRGKIYKFNKRIPKDVIEHEKAHCRAEKSDIISPKGVMAWLDDEVRADLLTYKETGRPERIYDRLQSRASDARVYHMDGVDFNYYQQTKHALEHIERAYQKYWDVLPEQWKRDYVRFMEYSGKRLGKLRLQRQGNPPRDYYLRWLKNGDYEVGKKKVVNGRDEVTGFVTKRVKE